MNRILGGFKNADIPENFIGQIIPQFRVARGRRPGKKTRISPQRNDHCSGIKRNMNSALFEEYTLQI